MVTTANKPQQTQKYHKPVSFIDIELIFGVMDILHGLVRSLGCSAADNI